MVYTSVQSIIPRLSPGIISPYRRTNHALSLTCIAIIKMLIFTPVTLKAFSLTNVEINLYSEKRR